MMEPAFTDSSKTTFCKVAMLQAQELVESQCMANPSGMSSILVCVSLTGSLLCSQYLDLMFGKCCTWFMLLWLHCMVEV